MDAIDRADLDASRIFATRLSDDVRHGSPIGEISYTISGILYQPGGPKKSPCGIPGVNEMKNEAALGAGLKVLDLGVGMPPAVATRLLSDAGAEVRRIECDGGDPFYDVYPAYAAWHDGKEMLPESAARGDALAKQLEWADLCVVGGEDFPGYTHRYDPQQISAQHPSLVVLHLGGYVAGTPDASRPAVDSLVQARSGLAMEHYSDRPFLWAFAAPTYGAALQGLIGALAALYCREESGRGQVVSTSLLQGALMWMAPHWLTAERPSEYFNVRVPKDLQQLIFKCADGEYVQIGLGSGGALHKLNAVLGIDDESASNDARGRPSGKGGSKNFWGDFDRWQARVITRESAALLQELWDAGVAADRVLPPGACWDDEQVAHNRIIVTQSDGVRRVGLPIDARELPGTAASKRTTGRAKRDGIGPLAGLRVIDLGMFIAGPYASQAMSDFGADVISVEPLTADPNRALFCAYAPSKRGKRALAVDMKTAAGAEIVRRLCSGADVVVHNFRPGVCKRLGLDAQTLRSYNPDVIVLENSGYGIDGPYADRAGFDMIFQAFCGHAHRGAGPGNPPVWFRSAIVDFGAGMLGAVGILASLIQRRRGRTPPALYVSLLNTAIFFLMELVQKADGEFAGAPSINRAQTGFHPAEQFYRTSDGWVAIAARSEDMARRLASALDLTTALARPRKEWSQREEEALAAAIAAHSTAEFLAKAAAADVWAEALDPDPAARQLADPDLQRVGIVLKTQDPEYGELRQIGPAVQFSASRLALDGGHTPRLGEHTREVLTELGYGPEEIEEFFRRGAVA